MTAGSSPVILLHGFGQHPGSWDDIAQELRVAGYAVVVPDLAELALEQTSMDHVCATIADLVRATEHQYGKPPVLVGYSLGGRLALETALRSWPESPLSLAALVLESAGFGPSSDEARQALAERNADWAQKLCDQGVEAFMGWWETLPLFATQHGLSADVRAKLREGRLRNGVESLTVQLLGWGQHRQASRADSLSFLKSASEQGLPISYFAGEEDRKYASFALAIQAAAPEVRVRLFPGVGHNVHLEDPAAFSAELLRCIIHCGV